MTYILDVKKTNLFWTVSVYIVSPASQISQGDLLPIHFLFLLDRSQKWAELQYTSWWDGSGMKFEMGGMDPTCCHPKPRPTNPRDFFDTSLLLYRKGMNTNHDSVNFWDSGRKSETFISYLPASFGPPNKSSIQSFR